MINMKFEIFFRAIVISGLIAIVIFIANAASAKQLSEIDWDAKADWSAVGHCGIHDRCFLISNLTSGVESHRSFPRPQLSSKVIRIEKKVRKPIKVDNKVKSGGKEFDANDSKLYDKFWSSSLEEQRKYPRLLRIKFVETKRYRRFLKQNPPRKDHPVPPMPPDFPYEGDEWALTKGDKRGFTCGQKLQATKYGKVSNQSKIGNKTINLEAQ